MELKPTKLTLPGTLPSTWPARTAISRCVRLYVCSTMYKTCLQLILYFEGVNPVRVSRDLYPTALLEYLNSASMNDESLANLLNRRCKSSKLKLVDFIISPNLPN